MRSARQDDERFVVDEGAREDDTLTLAEAQACAAGADARAPAGQGGDDLVEAGEPGGGELLGGRVTVRDSSRPGRDLLDGIDDVPR